MVLKVPEGDDKEREYDVVTMLPVQASDSAASNRSPLTAGTTTNKQQMPPQAK
jgi:hypothetical protein